MTFRILIVDDEKNIREGLTRAMELEGYKVFQVSDAQGALKMMIKTEIDLVIADLKMPKLSGEELLKRLVSAYPTVPVIILTGHGTVENAVKAMRDGAYDFLTKPVNLDRLALLTKRALSTRELIMKHRALQEEVNRLEQKRQDLVLLGRSSPMKRIFDLIEQVGPTKASILITGESGTGKELVVNAIHRHSPRKDAPLVKVHCAALSETLLESELFGHEKGSFTGASGLRKGRFELADGGTIFLDEIGEINQAIQIKILRVLQERVFERVGGEQSLSVDVRIIAATNRDLRQEVANGRFREDLYYRLNVIEVSLPPLRERQEDIPLLVAAFLREFSKENNKQFEGLEPKALMALRTYSWPGNVRELRNIIESAIILGKGPLLTLEDLSPQITGRHEKDVIRISVGTTMDEAVKAIIRTTLSTLGGNKSLAAETLGIGRKTLYRKIRDYGLEKEFFRDEPDKPSSLER